MSEIEQYEPPVEGVVICDATLHSCRCVLPVHSPDVPHECDPERCGGSWSGTLAGGDFAVHRFPLGITPSRLLGY